MEQFGRFTAYAFVTFLRADGAYRQRKITLANENFTTHAQAMKMLDALREQNHALFICAEFTVTVD